MVAGSNPAAATIEANLSQIAPNSFKKSQVLPEATETLQLRELLYILLGNKGRRHLELRQKPNNELFTLYEGELVFRHRSTKAIHEAERVLNHFHNYLGEYPPTPELAKSFLSNFSHRKPTTLARYAAELKLFLKWYGEDLDINIKVPKTLPSYVEKTDIEKLLEAVRAKKNHKNTINRDILLIDLAIHTGLRRSELASLKVGDIDKERQVLIVRKGKGAKDRIMPLSKSTIDKLAEYIKSKDKDSSLFGLASASISGKIKYFAMKAGVGIHTHSLRDYFATSLSEKGATIREIQSLLGHANLTHTERYTLHTDKHLKRAIELFDKEQGEEQKRKEQLQLQPIVILKVVDKKSWPDDDNVLRSDYFSHFVARNEWQLPIVEIEISLFDAEYHLLEIQKESVLGVQEEFIFKPIITLNEGSYSIICQYRSAINQTTNQTLLPFELKKASKHGEVYVIPGELEFKT
ncbi:tyrosine-type recombinase/integrase [Chloroflexota bacterium]